MKRFDGSDEIEFKASAERYAELCQSTKGSLKQRRDAIAKMEVLRPNTVQIIGPILSDLKQSILSEDELYQSMISRMISMAGPTELNLEQWLGLYECHCSAYPEVIITRQKIVREKIELHNYSSVLWLVAAQCTWTDRGWVVSEYGWKMALNSAVTYNDFLAISMISPPDSEVRKIASARLLEFKK